MRSPLRRAPQGAPAATRLRRLAARCLLAVSIGTGLMVVGSEPAHADVRTELRTEDNACLQLYNGVPGSGACWLTNPPWALEIVAWVGDSPRYRVRSLYYADTCLVAFASSGRVGTYRCNSAWADQVWSFQYVGQDDLGLSLFWLRNKHSGKCLALNPAYQPQAFMTTCSTRYDDQLWLGIGT